MESKLEYPQTATKLQATRSHVLVAVGLAITQSLILFFSIGQNGETIDEVRHLPAGLYYWSTGEFWPYHHNPPLAKLIQSAPVYLSGNGRLSGTYTFQLHDRSPDTDLAVRFWKDHPKDYHLLFVACRTTGVLFALLGSVIIWRWSLALYGVNGALLSLGLWTFCPFVLAHAGLVTPDVPATVFILLASYLFWRYLHFPTYAEAFLAGCGLGLAIATKFTAILLVPLWCVAAVSFAFYRLRSKPRTIGQHLGEFLLLFVTTVAVTNTTYTWENVGQRLGDIELRSTTLVNLRRLVLRDDKGAVGDQPSSFERFVESLPIPLPLHFVLGFDDQLWDLDNLGWWKYLAGEVRGPDRPGWWYYYLYGLVLKLPIGSLAISLVTVLSMIKNWKRLSFVDEIAIWLPALAILISVSCKTGMNSHVRYVLPCLPFLYVGAGRVAVFQKWSFQPTIDMVMRRCAYTCVAINAVSVCGVHPHYIAYFNEGVGGPLGGLAYLIDSNLDWGQGSVSLESWLEKNASGETVYLAYHGFQTPSDLGKPYRLRPFSSIPPEPGLHIISAQYLIMGMAFEGPGVAGCGWPPTSLSQYRRLEPIAVPGYSIYVYRVTESQISEISCQ